MILDLKRIKSYYEKNIQKGYTIEQISANLKNNKYPAYQLAEAIKLLDVYFVQMSQENPKKFDYSKLPNSIKSQIEPSKTNPLSLTKKGIPPSALQNATLPLQTPPKLETHPGLEGESLYKFIGILGGIFAIIIVVLLLVSNGSDNENVDIEENTNTIGTDFDSLLDDDLSDVASDASQNLLDIQNDSLNNMNFNESDSLNMSNEAVDDVKDTSDITTPTHSGKITPLPYIDTSNIVCVEDDDCEDQNPMTKDVCKNSECKHTIYDDPHDFCIPYDGHCREECYGYNDTDCVDEQGRVLCIDHEDCNDGNEYTEDLCDDDHGVCLYFPIKPEDVNHLPFIISEPNTTLFELQAYEYQVVVNDTDEDIISYELKSEPADMDINESNGLITWTPPATGNTRTTYTFTVKADDGKEEVEQEVELVVFMTEESDSLKQECETSQTCYENAVVALQEHLRCEYLGIYWDDADFAERDNCIFKIAYANKNLDLCQYIHDSSTKTTCLSIR